MKKLILTGPIGCGKSSMIRDVLGQRAAVAGGFVTLRRLEQKRLTGFDLAPAGAICDPMVKGQRFLSFDPDPVRNNAVFSGFGAMLLSEAAQAPFALADEFGGLELLVPEFRDGLWALMQGPTPCIGVLKAPGSARAMAQRIALGDAYFAAYDSLLQFLREQADVRILETTGWQDKSALKILRCWAELYAGGSVYDK